MKTASKLLATTLVLMFVLACAESEPEPDADVTAYVLAYHWGFALFDENGQEIETLEVSQGDLVELIAVNDHAFGAIGRLPQPVESAMLTLDLHARIREDIEAGHLRDPADFGTSLESELAYVDATALADDDPHAHHGDHGHYLGEGHEFAHRDTLMDHGLKVVGYDVEMERIPYDAEVPNRLVFAADRQGTFDFECTVRCGFGHPHPREMLVVQ